jgi:hypothetical protein
MIIAFHNSKGGVGTTMLAAHMCELARELGLRVVAVSAAIGDGLLRWYEPETPSVDFDPESSGAADCARCVGRADLRAALVRERRRALG